MKRLLCATDFSDAAEPAIEQAARMAGALGAEIVLLYVANEAPVWNRPLYDEALRRAFATQERWAGDTLARRVTELAATGVPARWLLRSGLAWKEIVRAAEDEQADMIVMGTQGRTGLDRLLLGSVAERVVRAAPCPVLTVRAQSKEERPHAHQG